jgi:transposase
MYIDECTYTTKYGKTHKRILIRDSSKKNGKTCKKTIANITHLPQNKINILKKVFSNNNDFIVTDLSKLKSKQQRSIGAVWLLHESAKILHIKEALGNARKGLLALWLVFSRLIDQGSRLSSVRLANMHAACEVLKIKKPFDENTLYSVLDWCAVNQEKIEKKLFELRYNKETKPKLFLYDITSSYLEGNNNEYADYGYNRDGKKNKKQIVIGLLTDEEGFPVSVKVFKGNKSDQSTVIDQIRKIKDQFGCSRITLVGDRGMIKSPQIEQLHDEDFNFISAITKAQIEKMLKDKTIDMELFDNSLCEIETDGFRYILRRNPIRCNEIRENRNQKIEYIKRYLKKTNEYLKEHKRAKPEIADRKLMDKINRFKLGSFVKLSEDKRVFGLDIDEDLKSEEEKLDGCYVLKTDLKKEDADKNLIHKRYKDLFFVEKAFKNMKTGLLETRPIFVRKKKRTEGHIFIVMLSYMIFKYLTKKWKDFNLTVEEGINELSTVCMEKIILDDIEVTYIPEPREIGVCLLKKLNITLLKICSGSGI